jgi:hypothetical protein
MEEALEHLSVMVALLLAMAAALVSSDTEAPQEVTSFFAGAFRAVAEQFRSQTADLGVDPGYLSGTAAETAVLSHT